MDIGLDRVCAAVVALLLAVPVAMSEDAMPLEKSAAPSDRAIPAGLWSLTAQPNAITLDDLAKQLHIDLKNYKVDGSPIHYELSALDEDPDKTKAHSPIRSLTLWGPTVLDGGKANQEIRIRRLTYVSVVILPNTSVFACDFVKLICCAYLRGWLNRGFD